MTNKKENLSGTKNWIILRITSIISIIYLFYILIFFSEREIDHTSLQEFFSKGPVKILTMFAVFSIVVHFLIGIQNILTDYIKNKKLRILIYSTLYAFLTFHLFYLKKIIF
ncbi:succinate dehydrogenase, hydrophobic membrane anchor protein [Candidatus Riesia pediculicola]|uniref:succinate dehydrogenase, hydrophobic membrane anchor protein n=1 Tax=Candidatus Riesia pediculicola TaxID=401619 RepID=UPI0009C21217|nr:hypothetical protein AOE57_01015 [Candidatus Riesia pediculicola]